MPTLREQYILDRGDYDLKNNLINEELLRLQNLCIALEDLIVILSPRNFDTAKLVAKIEDAKTKLASLLAVRNL